MGTHEVIWTNHLSGPIAPAPAWCGGTAAMLLTWRIRRTPIHGAPAKDNVQQHASVVYLVYLRVSVPRCAPHNLIVFCRLHCIRCDVMVIISLDVLFPPGHVDIKLRSTCSPRRTHRIGAQNKKCQQTYLQPSPTRRAHKRPHHILRHLTRRYTNQYPSEKRRSENKDSLCTRFNRKAGKGRPTFVFLVTTLARYPFAMWPERVTRIPRFTR
jgi:hypothetical protein